MSEQALKELWEGCEGSGELRLLLEDEAQAASCQVHPTPFAMVGREEDCDLV